MIFVKRFRSPNRRTSIARGDVQPVQSRELRQSGSTLGKALVRAPISSSPPGYTQAAAGSTFGLLRQTVERAAAWARAGNFQFALRVNF